MKNFCKTGYEYSELSEAAKEKAKQWYLDDEFRGQQLTEDFNESWLKYFFPNSKLDVQWSIASCQGDGVNIYGNLCLTEVVSYIKNYNPEEHKINRHPSDPRNTFTEKELRRITWYANNGNVDVATLPENRRYCYCMANFLFFTDDMISELEYRDIRAIDKGLIERFRDEVVVIIKDLCDEMETAGYEFLYEVEDDDLSDTCAANEWYFDVDGGFIFGYDNVCGL